MIIGMYGGIDNGPVRRHNLPYIAIDKGLKYLLRDKITPIVVIGDDDSLQDEALMNDYPHVSLPVKKDDTDTAYALRYAYERGYRTCELYGVMQGRMDHFLSVMATIESYDDFDVIMYDQTNRMRLLRAGTYDLDCTHYTYFSVFACDRANVTLQGAWWDLNHYELTRKDPLCTSNRCEGVLHMETDGPVWFLETEPLD